MTFPAVSTARGAPVVAGPHPLAPTPDHTAQPPAGSTRTLLRVVPDDLADADLSLDDLGSRIVGLAGRLAAATCRWLLLIASFDERQGYEYYGLGSTARWLSHHCGVSHRTALDHVRVAHALHDYPALVTEMSAGRLSYSHVRAISRAVAPSQKAQAEPASPEPAPPKPAPPEPASPEPASPEPASPEPASSQRGTLEEAWAHAQVDSASLHGDPAEAALVDELVNIARQGTVGQLEDMVRGLRTVERLDTAVPGTEPDLADYLDTRWDSDSRWHLTARIAPERGALIEAAVDRIARSEGIDRPQALTRMAEIALATLADGARPPRELRGDERAAVVLYIDIRDVPPDPRHDAPLVAPDLTPNPTSDVTPEVTSDLTPEVSSDLTPEVTPEVTVEVTPEGRAIEAVGRPRSAERGSSRRAFGRIAGGPGLPDAVIYRLLCDGGLRTVVYETDDAGRRRVLDVGRRRRFVTRKQYRVLLARDGGGCAVPGCASVRRLHVHHVKHWLHGGETTPDNEVILCELHHLQVHEDQLCVSAVAPGRFVFRRADGAQLLVSVDPSAAMGNGGPLESEYEAVAGDAAESQWDGFRMDRGYAVSCLASRRTARRRTGDTRGAESGRSPAEPAAVPPGGGLVPG